MNNKVIVGVVLVALVLLGAWYMRSDSQTGPAMEAQPTPSDASTQTSSGSAAPNTSEGTSDTAVREIVIEGSEFKFNLTSLTFKKGQKVKLILKNTGDMPHDWVVDELNARTKVISGGKEDVLEFTPDKAGTFEFYCSVGKHREMGMKGTLVVEE